MFIFLKKLQQKSLTDTCYSVPAALPAPAAAHVPTAGGSSTHGLAPLMTLAVLLLAIYSLHLFIATLVSTVLLGSELLM